jgi:hypothetical protein
VRATYGLPSIAVVVSLACIFAPDPARGCSICVAGDPILDASGASAQEAGAFGAYLELRGWTKRSGLLPGEGGNGGSAQPFEDNTTRQLNLFLSWAPVDRVTTSLQVPAKFTSIDEVEGGETDTVSTANLSDVTLATSIVLWRNRDILPDTWLESRAFLKMPSGPSRVERHGVIDPHVQPGTGSWDFGFGLAGTHKSSWARWYSSASYRVNTLGSLRYQYGDVFLWNGALLVPLGHATGDPELARFTPGLELNFRWAAKDVYQGEAFEHSGGSILYVTPSLRYRLPWFEGRRAPTLRAAGQIPVTQRWLNGHQHEGAVWILGILYPFSF